MQGGDNYACCFDATTLNAVATTVRRRGMMISARSPSLLPHSVMPTTVTKLPTSCRYSNGGGVCYRVLVGKALFMVAFVMAIRAPQSTDAKFLLSCRVISGICQEDGMCLHEMSSRFPDCYMDSIKRSADGMELASAVETQDLLQRPLPEFYFAPDIPSLASSSGALAGDLFAPAPLVYRTGADGRVSPNGVPQPPQADIKQTLDGMEKRGMKLRNILMKVDRIPVGK